MLVRKKMGGEKMRFMLTICAFAFAALASGCASVSGGNVQSMIVTAAEKGGRDLPGADCTLSNNKGSWRVKTPGETTIVRSNTAMTVKCEKEAQPVGIATVESATRAAMYGNILIGGVVGAAIDHTSGAAYEYPVTVRVVMGDVIAIAPPKPPNEATAGRHAPKVHDKQFDLPAATGFANAADVNAVPSEAARLAYGDWLQKPPPRAFVLSSDGRPFWAFNTSAAVQRAMDRCGERHTGCRLYAYDDVVVWKATYALETPRARKEAAPQRTVAATATAETPVRIAADSNKEVLQPAPVASGYAALNDIGKLPTINPKLRAAYETFLTRPLPRAFALSENGGWWASWGTKPKDPNASIDPSVRVIPDCEKYHQRRCTVYAINEVVVYKPEQKQASQ
jgi:hypothetical protein